MSETMADFEKELEASFRKLNEGDVVEGVITGVDDNAVYLDINYHAQGIVKKKITAMILPSPCRMFRWATL